MRIEALRTEHLDARSRVVATVIWEDCARDPQDIFFETPSDFADALTCDAHAFLVGAILPAIHMGEQRIAIDAPVCPELHNGLLTAIGWFREWDRLDSTIRIEAASDVRYPRAIPLRAATFLSGGVDSLAVLRANRRDYPNDHPNAIQDAFFVHGFDIGGLESCGEELAYFDLALNNVYAAAEDAGTTLIPVHTNVRYLFDEVDFWISVFHGAAMAAVAHAFSNRITSVSMASGFRIPVTPESGHPLIETNFSSANLRIKVEDVLYSRLQRVAMLADWPVALENLRVCTMNPPTQLNCGECEKCLRTMLQLLACGCLDKTKTFPSRDVTPQMLESIDFHGAYQDTWFSELISPLTARGRLDLVEVIQRKHTEFQKLLAWEEERDWKGVVKRFDRRWLGESLYKTYAKILARRECRDVTTTS